MNATTRIEPHDHIPVDLRPVMEVLAAVGADLSQTIARGALGGTLGADVGENAGGDGQKALDIMADEAFAAAPRQTSIRYYGSEEQDEVVELNPSGRYALAIDPLDGSSNIDVNVSIGCRNGLLSTVAAGLPVVVTPSIYTDDQDFSEATEVLSSLDNFALEPKG